MVYPLGTCACMQGAPFGRMADTRAGGCVLGYLQLRHGVFGDFAERVGNSKPSAEIRTELALTGEVTMQSTKSVQLA